MWNVVWSRRMIGNIHSEFQTSSSSDCSIPTRQCLVGVCESVTEQGKASINAHNPIGILVTYNKSHILSDPPRRTHVHLYIHEERSHKLMGAPPCKITICKCNHDSEIV